MRRAHDLPDGGCFLPMVIQFRLCAAGKIEGARRVAPIEGFQMLEPSPNELHHLCPCCRIVLDRLRDQHRILPQTASPGS